MRAVRLLAVMLLLTLMPGCWVYSLHGLYDNEYTDTRFDPSLTGSWVTPGLGCVLTLTPVGAPSPMSYDVEYTAPKEKQDDFCLADPGNTVKFQGWLVQIGDHRFLDLSPRDDEVCFQCLPVHTFLRVMADNGSLFLVPMDHRWLTEALLDKRITLDTYEQVQTADNAEPIILTVSTRQLRQLMTTYADDKEAFQVEREYVFERK